MTYHNWSASCRHGQARPAAAPLRIIRMPASKPWRRPERPPPAVFLVDQASFRELVQRLTGAPTPRPIMPAVTEAGLATALPPGVAAEMCVCRVQKYVGEGREDRRQLVWTSPAGPADGDGIDRTAAWLLGGI